MPLREIAYTILPSADSTLAIEIFKTGLMRKKKHILFFENFSGELAYVPEHPEASRIHMQVDVSSVVCRDQWLKRKKQMAVAEYVKRQGLRAEQHPEIRFTSNRISPKPLRGFVVEGVLEIAKTTRVVKVNVVMNPRKNGSFQIDGDTNICLSDFGIKPPSSMFGLSGAKDEGLIRILLWATPAT